MPAREKEQEKIWEVRHPWAPIGALGPPWAHAAPWGVGPLVRLSNEIAAAVYIDWWNGRPGLQMHLNSTTVVLQTSKQLVS